MLKRLVILILVGILMASSYGAGIVTDAFTGWGDKFKASFQSWHHSWCDEHSSESESYSSDI